MTDDVRSKGLLIAQKGEVIQKSENEWLVRSTPDKAPCIVDLSLQTCTCKLDNTLVLPGIGLEFSECEHIYAAMEKTRLIASADGFHVDIAPESAWAEDRHPDDYDESGTSESLNGAHTERKRLELASSEKDDSDTDGRRKTYQRNWTGYNKAQTKEKALFLAMLSDLVDIVEQPEHTFGRPPLIRRDVMFACTYKIYALFSTRRFNTDLENAAEKGYITDVPHFNTINKYLNDPTVTKDVLNLIAVSAIPLSSVETSFAIDSSGFSTSGRVSWYNKRWGKVIDNREWLKVHIACGTTTNIVTSASVSGWNAHDTNYFAPLLEKTSEAFNIERVSADRAYLSHDNLELAWLLGAYPFIPFKSNTVPVEKDGTIWAMMYDMYMNDYENWKAHYHQRSNVESTFSMVKGKFGESIRMHKPVAQVNEALCKILCHNIVVLIHEMFDLGIVPIFATGKSLKARIATIK